MTVFLAGLGLGLSLIVAIGAQNVFVLRQGIRREHIALVVAICIASDAVLIVAGVGGLGMLVTAVPWLVEAARWAGAAFLVGYGILAARRAWHSTGDVLDATAPSPEPALSSTSPAPPTRRPQAAEVMGNRASDAADPRFPITSAADDGGVAEGAGGREPGRGAGTGDRRAGARGTAVGVALTCLALTWLNPHVYLDTVFLIGSIAASYGDARWVFAAGAVLASALWFTALGVGARGLGRVLRTRRAWRILDALVAVVMFAIAASLLLG